MMKVPKSESIWSMCLQYSNIMNWAAIKFCNFMSSWHLLKLQTWIRTSSRLLSWACSTSWPAATSSSRRKLSNVWARGEEATVSKLTKRRSCEQATVSKLAKRRSCELATVSKLTKRSICEQMWELQLTWVRPSRRRGEQRPQAVSGWESGGTASR